MSVSETEVAAACRMLLTAREPDRHYIAAMLEAQQAEIERLTTQVEIAEVNVKGAVQRGLMMFRAKNGWADRARQAEAEIQRLRETLHAIDALREAAFVRGDVAYILGQMHEHIQAALLDADYPPAERDKLDALIGDSE